MKYKNILHISSWTQFGFGHNSVLKNKKIHKIKILKIDKISIISINKSIGGMILVTIIYIF